jgi:hypothetical protein
VTSAEAKNFNQSQESNFADFRGKIDSPESVAVFVHKISENGDEMRCVWQIRGHNAQNSIGRRFARAVACFYPITRQEIKQKRPGF